MPRRDYEQHCGLARALDVLGERWTLLLVRDMLTGPKRFTDLAERFPAMGRNLLTQRLHQLVSDGVLQQSGRRYQLTPLGQQLLPAIEHLAIWGLQVLEAYPSHRTANPIWTTLTMRAGGNPEACRDVRGTVGFHVDDERFRVELDHGSVAVTEGDRPDPSDLIVTCDHFTYASIGYRVLTIEEASALGALRLEGDRTLLDVCFEVLQFPPYPAMEALLGRSGPPSSRSTDLT